MNTHQKDIWRRYIRLLLLILTTSAALGQPTTRQFTFDIRTSYVPLQQSLQQVNTAIYNTWPAFNKHLPDYATIASTHAEFGHQGVGAGGVLMSQPIHVIEGDILEVTLINHLDSTGLSIHWHGFEMMNSLEYDGVVGITQCPIAPQETMVYKFQVDETPGTYWYHTHSGPLGVNAKNEIKAPLIVHPRSTFSETLVKELHENTDSLIETQGSFDSLNFYSNERLLFFADGYLVSESHKQLKKTGGLNPPVCKNDDGFTVGSFPYHYGTCNGKLREVIPVEAGQRYKLRLLNGGNLYGFRISIDGLPMTIIAADSEPVVPYEVDEVILHSAERFDVEIDIPLDMANTNVWIRADTLESKEQGYQNGVRAILNVMPPGKLNSSNNFTSPIVLESPMNIPDPIEDIVSSNLPIFERKTINCNSRSEIEQAKNSGECLAITELASLKEEELNDNELTYTPTFIESHTVDFEFSPPPSFAHFVRIDGGLNNQHVNPLNSHFLQTGLELHENTAMLHVSSFSSVLIIWRNKSLMDHPIHLHGYKMEILDIYRPKRELHCSRSSCELPIFYDSEEKLQELDARIRDGVMKDTFILPAGGAVVTRIHTFEPSVWFAHCHLETHREDGMALIMNVGNYTAPEDSSWLPEDFLSCDHPFLKGANKDPACTCFQDKDAVLGIGLTEDYRCSRDYLCSHVDSEVSHLFSYKPSGVSMRSQYRIPNYGLTLIFLAIIAFLTFSVIQLKHYIKNSSVQTSETMRQSQRQSIVMRFNMKNSIAGKKGISHLVSNEISQQYFSTLDFWTQLQLLTASQFKAYRPGCVNLWRIFEVSTLAMLVGLLFYDVGNKETSESLTQKSGLLFFSLTLWTFTRMYPAVGSTSIWRNLAIDFSKSLEDKNVKMKYVVILWLARVIVVFVCESWLPLIHVLVAYPMAGMFGRIDSCLKISMFLMMNNLCYVSIGSFLGAITSNVSIGMIVSTLVSQTSLLAAGFYTTLPPVINLLRYISPVTYTYTGILKSSFRSSDTYRCRSGGQSDIGANQCYIEQSVGIDILKRRGINVATFNDPYTESIWMEVMILFGLYVMLNCAVLAILLFKIHRRKGGDADMIDEEDRRIVRVANSETSVERRSSTWSNASFGLERKNQLDLAFLADVTKYDDEQSKVSSLNPFLDRDSMGFGPRFRSSPGSPGYSGRRTNDPKSFSTVNPKRFRSLNKKISSNTMNMGSGRISLPRQSSIKKKINPKSFNTINPRGFESLNRKIGETNDLVTSRISIKRAEATESEMDEENKQNLLQGIEDVAEKLRRYMDNQAMTSEGFQDGNGGIVNKYDLDSGKILFQDPQESTESMSEREGVIENKQNLFHDIENVTEKMMQRFLDSQSQFDENESHDSTLNPSGDGEEERSITQTKEDPERVKTSIRGIRSIYDLDSGRITKQTPLQFKEDIEDTEVDNRKKFFQDIQHVTGQMKRYMDSQSKIDDDESNASTLNSFRELGTDQRILQGDKNSIRYRPSTENMMDIYDLDNGRILLPRRQELDRAQMSQNLEAIRGFADDLSYGDLSC